MVHGIMKKCQGHPRFSMLMLFCSIPEHLSSLDHQLPYLEIMTDLFILLAILTGRVQAVFPIMMHDSILFVSVADDNWEPSLMLQSRNVSEATEGMYYLS